MTIVAGTDQRGHSTPDMPKRHTGSSVEGSHRRASDTAQALVDAVHRGDQFAVQRILRRPDLPRIAVTLAERHKPTPPQLAPCGTRSAAERHRRLGELLDDDCLEARREYYRDRSRRRRSQAQLAPPPPVTHQRPARLADVDPVVVERLVHGHIAGRATRHERYLAYSTLRDRGMSHSAALVYVHASSASRTVFAADYTRDRNQEVSA